MDFDLLKYTLSDLLIKYKYENNDVYLNEIKRRLLYCGFSKNVIDYLIKEESKLIKKNVNLIENIRITNDFKIEELKGKEDKLLLTELLCIIDEAMMITKYFAKDYSKALIDELESLNKEDGSNFLVKEFYQRIENYFRKANNLEWEFKGFYYEDHIDKLYENELDIIILNRWHEYIDLKVMPYTGE